MNNYDRIFRMKRLMRLGHYRRPQVASSLFLTHNAALAPPYRVLIDTNFINFSLQNKLELIQGMMDCLYAKCKALAFVLMNDGFK